MKVGQGISTARAGWSFGGDVANSFVDHARSSIPLYDYGHDLICQASDFFCLKDSTCYELGTSTGELIRKLARHNSGKPNIRWIGIDIEESMVNYAQDATKDLPNVEFRQDNIITCELEKSDLITSYYAIQFVPPRHRQDVINKIYSSLNWGGAFLYFEKVRGPDARFQDIVTTLYTEYKLSKGLNAEEIVGKTLSLKSVQEPFSTAGNLDLLARAGFKDVMTIMKYVCFEGFLAIK